MRWSAAAVVVGALLMGAGCGDQLDTATGARDAAVRVEAEGCRSRPTIGAGSFVAEHRVLTVAHVVAGSTDIDVTLADGTEVDAHVVAMDRSKDLALLAVDTDVAPLPLGRLRPGESGQFVVWRDDAPEVRRFTAMSFVDINASNIDHDGTGLRKGFQIDAEVSNGDSGSILVHDGEAVAVIFARSTSTGTRAWATDIREAAPLLHDTDHDGGDGSDASASTSPSDGTSDGDGDGDRVVDVGPCAGG